MKSLHNKLAEKYGWYDRWHQRHNHKLFHWIIFTLFAGLVIFFFASIAKNAAAEAEKLRDSSNFKYLPPEAEALGFAPDRILLAFKDGVGRDERDLVLKKHGLAKKSEIQQIAVQIVSVPAGMNPKKLISQLASAEGDKIDFAETDDLLPPSFLPNDPYFPNEWHLAQINTPLAWDTTNGSGTIIAIADTGVDQTHPDLAANLVPGWNLYDSTGDTSDVYGHGTAVAGAAAAVGNNGTGVAGVAYGAKIMPLRVSDTNGNAYYSIIANAIAYAADNGAKVINVSYQAGGSQTVQRAARYMFNKNGLVVISEGNTGGDSGYRNSQYIISVSATDNYDLKTSWSTYGNDVDVAAPGQAIWSTARGGGVGAWSGTSFSAPITSGVLTLIWSANPDLSASQVQDVLFKSAADFGTSGWDQSYGWGRVDAGKAVEIAKNTTPTASPSTKGGGKPK